MIKNLLFLVVLFVHANLLFAQDTPTLPTEEDYYKIIKIPVPEGVVLEVGGVCTLPNGNIAVSHGITSADAGTA